jgi:hypothetical protein
VVPGTSSTLPATRSLRPRASPITGLFDPIQATGYGHRPPPKVVNVDTNLSEFPRLSSGALNAANANLNGADLFGAKLSGASLKRPTSRTPF